MSKQARPIQTKEFQEEAVKRVKEQGSPLAGSRQKLGRESRLRVDGNGRLKKAKMENPILPALFLFKAN